MSSDLKVAPKKLRLGSWPLFYMTFPIWSMALFSPVLLADKLGKMVPQLATFFGLLGLTTVLGAIGYGAWKLSINGMTFRHFVAGYQVRHRDGRIPNIFVLYAREFVAVFTASFVLMKVLLPAILKRGLSAGLSDEDKHIVVANSSGQVFVSNNSIGTMRDNQAAAEVKNAMEHALAKAHFEEWFHDKLFSTAPVLASRMEVLKFKKPTSQPNQPIKKAS